MLKDVEVFPNPANDHISVTEMIKGSKVEIFDLPGTNIIETVTQGNSLTLNLSQLKAGVYFIKITIGQDSKTVKFIKE
jgi:trimeric autotransporter adhesin